MFAAHQWTFRNGEFYLILPLSQIETNHAPLLPLMIHSENSKDLVLLIRAAELFRVLEAEKQSQRLCF